MYEDIISQLKSHDESVIDRCAVADDQLTRTIVGALGELDRDSRTLAAECLSMQGSPLAAAALLRLATDEELTVAVAAVDYLGGVVGHVPTADLLEALRNQEEPSLREKYYEFIGSRRESAHLEALRELRAEEDDPEAELAALVTVVQLGGEPERREFLGVLEEAEADDAVLLAEHLRRIGDARLLRGLLPWLTQQDDVFRLGSDRNPDEMVRMCDLAVWTAFGMGLPLDPPLTHIDNYPPETLSQATRLLQQIAL
jgi:HEAT repeat protein